LDPLLLWLALFAFLYGARLWIDTNLVRLELPATPFFRDLRVALGYIVPIPAFYFFKASGFLGRWASYVVSSISVIFLALFFATFLLGPRDVLDTINDIVVVGGIVVLAFRTVRRRTPGPDYVVLRTGVLVFAAFVLYSNVAGAVGHYIKLEPFGFAFFLGCLGYVAARQTLQRQAQLRDIQKELEVARRMQLSILPAGFPESRNFRVAARYLPMTAVAGDFYDFLVGDDDQAGLLIADVSGHGVPAALIASMVKMAATAQRSSASDPALLLTGMNAALCGNTQQQFVTAAYVHLDSASGHLSYSAAGHPPMLLMRKGEVTAVEENGLILAAFSFSAYTNASCKLEPGDRLLLYTDGILEAANSAQEEFGRDRLKALLQECSTLSHTETADRIMAKVQSWAASQEDDLTVLVCDHAWSS